MNSYDISDDGQIDQKELANMIGAMVKDFDSILVVRDEKLSFSIQYDLVGETDRKGERDPKKRAAEILAALDVAGDRKLSREEFIAG